MKWTKQLSYSTQHPPPPPHHHHHHPRNRPGKWMNGFWLKKLCSGRCTYLIITLIYISWVISHVSISMVLWVYTPTNYFVSLYIWFALFQFGNSLMFQSTTTAISFQQCFNDITMGPCAQTYFASFSMGLNYKGQNKWILPHECLIYASSLKL